MAKKDKGIQDSLIPDEITPLQLLPLSAAAGAIKKAASAFRVKAARLLEYSTKDEYVEKYKGISPYVEALYDADAAASYIIDEATLMDDLMTYPTDTRRRIMRDDLERSFDPFHELPTTDDVEDGGEAVDPNTGEIK
ncbi:hypothetical protein [Bifidobacterium olomucense]|uniref:Uncharacterized protein n=1 Tax=Bifidobacterium olomucense TaxID=2675324 RepID=A0A7Y0EZV0_9BIFI|nr:hypothetical protein [Bifidobacterium sp. DSM 109959]NMM99402.1 hypothetical protein [Bifidobacterium sp. DSM 109959]